MIITGVSDTTFYTYYTDTPGSSRLKSITGMGSVQMRYDTLGNLTADTSRQIYSIAYDYRNLPTQTYVAANQSGGAHNWIDFKYDETEQRIQKTWHYQVWALCEGGGEDFLIGGDSTGEGGAGTNSEGGGGCPPGQICGDSCLGWVEASTFYLYDDDGTLLATFDKTDAVLDLFVTGPEGTIASYSQNNNSYLYYYLKDQIGSTRVTVSGVPPNATNPYTVNQYYTYHPFGGVNESWGSYNTQFKFTGKEHDKHSSFEFDYFGARYYDSRTGLFMTADKAAQFLSAYLYGGNNPILGRDANGNWFGIDDLIISAVSFAVSFTSTLVTTWDFEKAFYQGVVGAASGWLAYNTGGAAAGLFAKQGSALYALGAGTIGGAVGGGLGSIGSQLAATGSLNGLTGRNVWGATVAGAAGGFAGGAAGLKIKDPIGASIIGGATSGGIQAAYNGTNIGAGIAGGAFWGSVSAVATQKAYEAYGNHLKNSVETPESQNCEDFASAVGKKNGIKERLEWTRKEPPEIEHDIIDSETGEVIVKASAPVEHDVHYGISLGRTPYGQEMVLSKLGPNLPVTVQTANSLSSHFSYRTPTGALYSRALYHTEKY